MDTMSKINYVSKYLPYIIAALILAVVVYVRIRLLTIPLERDEGEFAYMGQLLLKGIPPFNHAYTMKLPGVSIMYAFFMLLFGQTPTAIHTGLLIVNGICVCLVYLLTKRLFDSNAALYSCAIYAVLSLSCSLYAVFAHATHFVVLFALTGFLLVLRSIEHSRNLLLFISGLCFGLAVTMKQHAVVLLFFAILYFIWRFWRNPDSDKKQFLAGGALFLLGTIIPYAMIILWMAKAGSFTDFWFWTVQYARAYTATSTLASGWHNFTYSFIEIMKVQFPLWLLAGFAGIFLCIKKSRCADWFFVVGLLLFSFLSVCPGWYFRGHYFILFLPAVSIVTGAGIHSAGHFFSSTSSARFSAFIPAVLFLVAITGSFYLERDNFFVFTPVGVSRATYGGDPFPEALQIADYIKNNTAQNDKIAVLGSEPEILFYADRLSATGYIYMYGLMEDQPFAERMQTQMIREIEAARPKYFVVVNVDTSWVIRKSSIKSVFKWGDRFVKDLYDPVGVIDIIDTETTRYLWGESARGYTPVSQYFVTVFKRKSGV